MGKWVTGDLHVHTHACADGTLPVGEIIARSRKYCDFIGISGHAYAVPEWGKQQYQEILEAREQWPDMPIFHTAEQNFPIERHTMFVTVPENREVELQRELIARYHRQSGHEGIEQAREELEYVKGNWGSGQLFMIFNHPNAPDVSFENFLALAQTNDVFKVIACVDRRERRAPQMWDVGREWDRLLQQGHRLYARCGSDFHHHYTDGGTDYLPGEFVQDHVWVEENTYTQIVDAYRNGRFFCTVGNCISDPVFTAEASGDGCYRVTLRLNANCPMEQIDIISDGQSVQSFRNVEGVFVFEGILPGKGYFRVRGWGYGVPRKYAEGEFMPLFLLNPIFV